MSSVNAPQLMERLSRRMALALLSLAVALVLVFAAALFALEHREARVECTVT